MANFFDRVLETTTTTGTGNISLAGAPANYVTFGSVLANAATCHYTIVDSTNNTWECGLGTYNTSGNTLSRTTVNASSSAGSAVSFAAGTKQVFMSPTGAFLTTVPQNTTSNTFTTGTQTIITGGSSIAGFVVRGAASQTAKLIDVQSNSSVSNLNVSPFETLDYGGSDISLVQLNLLCNGTSTYAYIRPWNGRGLEIGGGVSNELKVNGYVRTDFGVLLSTFSDGSVYRTGANGAGFYNRISNNSGYVAFTDQSHGSGSNSVQVGASGPSAVDAKVVTFAHQVADFTQPIGRKPATFTVSANQNNYDPFGGSYTARSARLRLNVTSASTITGFGFFVWDGLEMVITNVGTQNLTLAHQSTSSTSGNRFLLSAGADRVIAPNATVVVWYDSTSTVWRDQ